MTHKCDHCGEQHYPILENIGGVVSVVVGVAVALTLVLACAVGLHTMFTTAV